MDRSAVVELVERVAAVDPRHADRSVLTSALTDIASMRAWLDGREVAVVGALALVASFPARCVAEAERVSMRHGERVVERAALAASLPAFGEAMDDGRVSGAHVDAMGHALRALEQREREQLRNDQDHLARLATALAPDAFARELRSAVAKLRTDDGMSRLAQQRRNTWLRTRVDTRTGMWCLSGEFDPLTGAAIAKRLQAAVETMFRDALPETAPSDPIARQEHLRALALAELVMSTGFRSGRGEIVAVIDADAATPSGEPAVDWGLPVEIPARVLAALAGTLDVNAVIVRNGVVLHAPGQLNLGRTTRVANRAQRRALRAWYPTCAVPGCQVHYDRCKIHHVTWWRHGGRTDIDNLLPLCVRHHLKVHEAGWVLDLGVGRSLTIRCPDGDVLSTGPPRRRAA